MFSVIKIREDRPADDYRDPGWHWHHQRTVAYELRWRSKRLN